MDADSPPLMRADTLASQGEQLASRKAYQQAYTAHTEAARNYQVAAQATSDTTAAKALLMQRDKQLRLAGEVKRKLESKGSSAQRGMPQQAPTTGYAVKDRERDLYARRVQHQAAGGATGSVASNPYGTGFSPSHRMGSSSVYASHYTPRERLPDTSSSTMADSRISRKSSSPSASQISSSVAPYSSSGDSSRRPPDSVEESYYLLRNESDPADPITTFLNLVNNMVENWETGNAVAFASIPLQQPPVPADPKASEKNTTPPKTASKSIQGVSAARPSTAGPAESFYVVPQQVANGERDRDDSLRQSTASTKTHEELVHENATLKETLDRLSKQLDWLNKERQRDRDAMMGSVTLFARDVRKQAERVIGQSVANLAESRRNLPRPGHPIQQAAAHQSAPPTAVPAHQSEDVMHAHRRIQELQDELKAAKQEVEKQAARAQQYKSKYDDLRTAILEKRKVKAATAAAAASAGGAVKSPDAKAAAPPPIGNAQWSNDSQETKGGPGHGPDTDAGKDGG